MRPWRSDVGTGPVAAFVATVSKVLGKNGSIRFLGNEQSNLKRRDFPNYLAMNLFDAG